MGDQYIKWISNISKNDSKLVGEKCANLGELFNAKFPVPQAFAITTEAFNYFLEENKLIDEIKSILKRINIEDDSDLDKRSEEIRSLIINAKVPEKLREEILEAYDNFNVDLTGLENSPGALAILKSSREPVFVSVRASANGNNSFEKHQNVFINIRGNNELIDKIKICFSSFFTPNSIFHKKKNGLDNFFDAAIIIQKMINSDKSGIISTKNSVENDDILINAIFGQSDGVVSKKIKPDSYTLTRKMEVINENISEKKLAVLRTAGGQTKAIQLTPEKSTFRVLKTYEIKQLAELSLKIEEHFDAPQIIEFAIENEDIYILGAKEVNLLEDLSKTNNSEILPIVETKTKIKVIADSTEMADKATKVNSDGIGLIKIERIIAENGIHPLKYENDSNLEDYQKKLAEGLQKIVKGFKEKPLWIRTSNIRSDEYSKLKGAIIKKEENPLMGNHGIRFSLMHEEILRNELLAVKSLNDNGYECGIMLPMVISTGEIKRVKEIFNELGLNDIKLGIIIETPASAILIKDICTEGIDFISFDIDNLKQYTLVTDRNNEDTKEIFMEYNWATMKLISRVIRECKTQNIETSIFGKDILKTDVIEFLIKSGINSITTLPSEARKISEIIYKSENGEDYIQEREVGNDLEKGGEKNMEESEKKTLKPETISEEMGEAGETSEIKEEPEDEPKNDNEIEEVIDNEIEEAEEVEEPSEQKEENLKNPAEPEAEPIEKRSEEKEKPEAEPIDEEKPKKEDIFQ